MSKTMLKYFTTASIIFLFLSCTEGLMFPMLKVPQLVSDGILHHSGTEAAVFFKKFSEKIHTHIAILGWVTSALMGVIYFIVPMATGYSRYIAWCCYMNLGCHLMGMILMTLGVNLIGQKTVHSGIEQGSTALHKTSAFYKPIMASGGFFIILSFIFFAYNILRTLWGKEEALASLD